MLESLANLVVGQEDDCEGDEETKGVDVSHVGQLVKIYLFKFKLDFYIENKLKSNLMKI